MLDSCTSLLYLQLAGSELSTGMSREQRTEKLKQAFLGRLVLLVLDDCWDADTASNFSWVDPNTNSKILISSRVREVLEGEYVCCLSIRMARVQGFKGNRCTCVCVCARVCVCACVRACVRVNVDVHYCYGLFLQYCGKVGTFLI